MTLLMVVTAGTRWSGTTLLVTIPKTDVPGRGPELFVLRPSALSLVLPVTFLTDARKWRMF